MVDITHLLTIQIMYISLYNINSYIVGGTVGLVGGAVVGAIGAVALAVGGAIQGVTQVVRGAAATPEAIIAPSQGKWWSDANGTWVLTKLDEEYQKMLDIPEDDDDILSAAIKDANDTTKPAGAATATNVVDTAYYDALEIAPDAEPSKIKRQYYLLARK